MRRLRTLAIALVACIMIMGGIYVAQPQDATASALIKPDYKIYALSSEYDGKISIPSSYAQNVQLTGYSSKATYRVSSGNCVTVSSTGLIEPKYQTWYWQGNVGTTTKPSSGSYTVVKEPFFDEATVSITDGGRTSSVTVEVLDYSQVHADYVIQQYISSKINDKMTDLEKLKVITAFPAQYDYSASYSSYKEMIINGGGDCWASAGAIKHMCDLVGIPAHVRYAANDNNAGSGHRNVAANIGGKTYLCEAGYSGKAPRPHDVTEMTGGFSYKNVTINGESGVTIYQYDGQDTEITIPASIDGKKVIAVGLDNAYSLTYSSTNFTKVTVSEGVKYIKGKAFYGMPKLAELNLPSTLQKIDTNALTNTSALASLNIKQGAAYKVVDGCLYTSDMQSFVWYPKNNGGAKEYTIADGVKRIEEYAFFNTYNINRLVIPASVEYIGDSAIPTQSSIKSIVFQGQMPKSIHEDAFYHINATIYMPHEEPWAGDLDNRWGSALNMKYGIHELEMHAAKDASCFEEGNTQYFTCKGCSLCFSDAAAEHEIAQGSWVLPSSGAHIWASEPTITPATCEQDGSKVTHCLNCDAVKDVEVYPALGHVFADSYTVDKRANMSKYKDGVMSIHCTREGCQAVKNQKTIYANLCATVEFEDYQYTGRPVKPEVIVESPERGLLDKNEYTLTYANNVTPGLGEVYVVFDNEYYCGILKEYFEIVDKYGFYNPEDPNAPTNPEVTIPDDPSNPSNPDNPSNPANPSDPDNPSDPTGPGLGSEQPDQPDDPQDPSNLGQIKVGKKKTIKLDLSNMGTNPVIKVANKKIATISKTGVIKGIRLGTTEFSIQSSEGQYVHGEIYVATPLSKPVLTKTSYVYNGQAQMPALKKLNGKTTLVEGQDYIVHWPVEPVNAGTYSVVIEAPKDSKYAGSVTAKYTIKKAKQIITCAPTSVYIDDTCALNYDYPGTGAVTFKSSAPAVAKVDALGNVTGLKAGSAKITIAVATDTNYLKATKTIKVTVVKLPQPNFKLTANESFIDDGYTIELAPGEAAQLAVADGAIGKVTFASSNTKIATVTSAGAITAKKAGTVTISAKAAGDVKYAAETKKIKVIIK